MQHDRMAVTRLAKFFNFQAEYRGTPAVTFQMATVREFRSRWLRAPATTDACDNKPSRAHLREEVGLLLARRKSQDRGQIAAQHDRQLACVRHERHLVDQRAEHLRSASALPSRLCRPWYKPATG